MEQLIQHSTRPDAIILLTMATAACFALLGLFALAMQQVIKAADYDAFDNMSLSKQRRVYTAEVNEIIKQAESHNNDRMPHV